MDLVSTTLNVFQEHVINQQLWLHLVQFLMEHVKFCYFYMISNNQRFETTFYSSQKDKIYFMESAKTKLPNNWLKLNLLNFKIILKSFKFSILSTFKNNWNFFRSILIKINCKINFFLNWSTNMTKETDRKLILLLANHS